MAEVENYTIQNNDGEQCLKNDFDDKTVYGHERNKFKGLGEYTCKILKEKEKRINELVEITKLEYPQVDKYFVCLCSVEFVMEELGLKTESDAGKQMYEDFLKEREKLIYNNADLKQEK